MQSQQFGEKMLQTAVIDTNVLISATFWNGIPAELFIALEQGRFNICLTPKIIQEYSRVLSRPEFKARFISQNTTPEEVVDDLLQRATIIADIPSPIRVKADPTDEIFIACAITAKADAIISGDRHLLNLKSAQGIPILTPKQFLDLM